jgi:hypothetical protein
VASDPIPHPSRQNRGIPTQNARAGEKRKEVTTGTQILESMKAGKPSPMCIGCASKEVTMNKVTLSLLLVLSVYLLAATASWAQQQPPQNTQAPRLYQQCQDRLKRDPKNVEAKQLCDEGMKLHREGKQEEAIKTIQEGLAKFK